MKQLFPISLRWRLKNRQAPWPHFGGKGHYNKVPLSPVQNLIPLLRVGDLQNQAKLSRVNTRSSEITVTAPKRLPPQKINLSAVQCLYNILSEKVQP